LHPFNAILPQKDFIQPFPSTIAISSARGMIGMYPVSINQNMGSVPAFFFQGVPRDNDLKR